MSTKSVTTISTRARSPKKFYATLVLRALQVLLSLTIAGVFVRLLATSWSATPKPELILLLAFTSVSIIQALAGAVFTWFAHERTWLAICDLACCCGFVVTAIMTRGVTASYTCDQWLSGEGSTRGDDGMAMMVRRDEGERGECTGLRGVFGMAVVQCVLLLVTFQMIFVLMRARNFEMRMRNMTEKHWRAWDGQGHAGAGAGGDPYTRRPAMAQVA